MKAAQKLLGLTVAVVSLGLVNCNTAVADGPHGSGSGHFGGGGSGHFGGGPGSSFHGGGFSRGTHGWSRGGSWGGTGHVGGRYYGGFGHRTWGGYSRYCYGGYPLSFGFAYYDVPYDYYPSYYDYEPPTYYSPPVVYEPSPAVQAAPPQPKVIQMAPLGIADVKALAKAGISDEVIISQIRNSRSVYYLSAAEIIDLKNSGVSEKVIDFMINTASQSQR